MGETRTDAGQPAGRAKGPPRPLEIVIVDDHPLLLRGLVQMFTEDDRFRVVATATDGERAVEAAQRFNPDVMILGWIMPYLNGEAVLRRLRELGHPVRVVVYTGVEDPDVPRRVLELGGAAFCSKRNPPEQLLEAAATVGRGDMVFPYVDVRALAGGASRLSEREREVWRELASGRTVGQIARQLGVSPNTVKFHLKNLYDKLQVRNRSQAVVQYLKSNPSS